MFSKFASRFMVISSLLLLSACSYDALANKLEKLPELQNLQTLGQKAQQNQLPIMFMFSADWCEYCDVLKEHVLNPMIINGMYEGKVVFMRNVGIDLDEPIPDWNGKPLDKGKWAYQIDADLTPTVVFFDGYGNEIAERIVGISEITLFAALVHTRINEAYQNMGLNKRIPATPELLELQQQR